MIEINLTNIPNLVTSLRTGRIGLERMVDELEGILSENESNVCAFVPEENRFSRLRKDVELLLENYPIPEERPPLYGLPIGVKDIFHVETFQTRAGSRIPPEELIGPEAAIIKLLKKSGAIILGKTHTTEFAYFGPGPTRNPQNIAHTPGGSSSGSAAAVASGMIPFAFGTQTIGSVIRPASYCGVVGYKPTFSRISTHGVIPLAPSVDTVGYFTADVVSTQFMAIHLCKDWNPEYINHSKPILGIPIGPYLAKADDEMLRHFFNTSRQLTIAGYEVKKIPAMMDFEIIFNNHNKIVAFEAAQTHERWFREFHELYHPKTTELILKGKRIDQKEYISVLLSQEHLREEITTLSQKKGIDLWLSPPAQDAAPLGLESTGNPIMNLPWTHCGLPTINIPSGKNEKGLPLGLQLTGLWNQDETLLNWSLEIEKVLRN